MAEAKKTAKPAKKAQKTSQPKKPETSAKSSPKTTEITSSLTWLPKKTFELEITVPRDIVDTEYNKALTHVASHTTIKGFRQGKAPKKLVEEQVGKTKILEEAVQKVVTRAYTEAVRQHNLSPVVSPEIKPEQLKENEAWIIKATSCEAPDVKLGNYKEEVKGVKAKDAIWTPDKAGKEEIQDDVNQKLEKIFDVLLQAANIEVSNILIEEETNRMLSGLMEQVNAAGLSMQQFLKTRNLTSEKLREQYQKSATDNLKLEFALAKIAQEEKISVSDKEIEDFIAKQDEKHQESFKNPQQKAYLAIVLRKQKTVDFLKNL
jgi:FKBP-type peptidyl-prolyl cis-trans isomerase (trigger factor)